MSNNRSTLRTITKDSPEDDRTVTVTYDVVLPVCLKLTVRLRPEAFVDADGNEIPLSEGAMTDAADTFYDLVDVEVPMLGMSYSPRQVEEGLDAADGFSGLDEEVKKAFVQKLKEG